jgi:hypothetical protein
MEVNELEERLAEPEREVPGSGATLKSVGQDVAPESRGCLINGSDGQPIHVNWRVLADFPSKSEFIAFYVPAVKDEVATCVSLADSVHPVINSLSQHVEATGGYSGEATTLRDLTFSGRVFIYHEWPLSNKQKADVVETYSAKGMDVQFRGVDYLSSRVLEWERKHRK